MVCRHPLNAIPCTICLILSLMGCDESNRKGEAKPVDLCAAVECYAHATCDDMIADCNCDAGYGNWTVGVGCSRDPLAIVGSFADQFGMHYEVTQGVWTQIGFGAVSRFFVAQYSNAERYLIAQNAAHNDFGAGLWSRFDWVDHDDGVGSAIWVCQTTFDAGTEAAALATAAADSSEPATSGCGGGSWSKFVDAPPMLSITGSYSDPYGGRHAVLPSMWTFGGFGNTSYFHITQFSNADGFVIAQNNAHNGYYPGLWSRFDWTWLDGGLFICQSAFAAASEADAIATTAADDTDPASAGCWGFSWSGFSVAEPVLILAGEWTDADGTHHTLTHDEWSQWIPYAPAETYRYVVRQLSNEDGWAIAKNDADNPTGAVLWSRFDWRWYDAGIGQGLELWVCHTVAAAVSQADALAATAADARDPSTGGCGAVPWSRFTPWVVPPCEVPQAPALPIVHRDATLTFVTGTNGAIEVGVGSTTALLPQTWMATTTIDLAEEGGIKVFARLVDDLCVSVAFVHTYDVRPAYPPAAGEAGTTAVAADATDIVGWATNVASVTFGDDVDEAWQITDKALGAASGPSDIVGLGRGGNITLSFDPAIVDGDGYDLAVFENGFAADFLELAWVEVSSDGLTFLRFDNAYLGNSPLGPFDRHDTGLIGSLAGKYEAGYGTPFDLSTLANRPEVLAHVVDLAAIIYVRVVDIVGDGSAFDSFGHVIYDPYPTTGSAGFDLDAVAVLNQ